MGEKEQGSYLIVHRQRRQLKRYKGECTLLKRCSLANKSTGIISAVPVSLSLCIGIAWKMWRSLSGFLVTLVVVMVSLNGAPIENSDTPIVNEKRAFATEYFLVMNGPGGDRQDPLITPITQLGHVITPGEQMFFFYPSLPLNQEPLVQFQRQDGNEFDLFKLINNWWQPNGVKYHLNRPHEKLHHHPDHKPNELQDNKDKKPEGEKPAQPKPGKDEKNKPNLNLSFPQPIQHAHIAIPPPLPLRHVYILSGQPQFIGNYDAFVNPLNPLYHIPPIFARSKDGAAIEAEPAEEAQPILPADLKLEPTVVAEEPAPLQQDAETPLLMMADTVARANSRVEPVPEVVDGGEEETGQVKPERKEQVEEVVQGKFNAGNFRDTLIENNFFLSRVRDASLSVSDIAAYSYNDPSVAQAAPAGLSIAGPGGVASSQPTATAVSGSYGIALASPKATSIAGDFFDFDDKKKADKQKSDKKKDE